MPNNYEEILMNNPEEIKPCPVKGELIQVRDIYTRMTGWNDREFECFSHDGKVITKDHHSDNNQTTDSKYRLVKWDEWRMQQPDPIAHDKAEACEKEELLNLHHTHSKDVIRMLEAEVARLTKENERLDCLKCKAQVQYLEAKGKLDEAVTALENIKSWSQNHFPVGTYHMILGEACRFLSSLNEAENVHASLAQRPEQGAHNATVDGSNPSGSTEPIRGNARNGEVEALKAKLSEARAIMKCVIDYHDVGDVLPNEIRAFLSSLNEADKTKENG